MRRVVKIGGSLLTQANLASTLRSWVETQPSAMTFAIVGGGELIDAIRRLDKLSAGEPAQVHWKCVELLEVTFSWLGAQLEPFEDWELIRTREEFDNARERVLQKDQTESSSYLVDVRAFYFPGCDAPLPEDWSTTTDAIAGWLAIKLLADELVLLKSCDVGERRDLGTLADAGVIDAALPKLQDDLPPIRFVNFASELRR